eukprot:ANDGO_04578.mRNA.1 EF-hand calcium-binding domain-containing protein 11 OS=Rattus norvegicus GN=Efcab11 PE=2 SV=1
MNAELVAQMFPADRITAVFHSYDRGSKGHLTRHEFTAAHIALVGIKPGRKLSADEVMTAAAFHDRMTKRLQLVLLDDAVRLLFRSLDATDKGYLTLHDLQHAAVDSGLQSLSDSPALMDAFLEADSDHDGRISYREFQRVMEYSEQLVLSTHKSLQY